jgi:hypothetical protein
MSFWNGRRCCSTNTRVGWRRIALRSAQKIGEGYAAAKCSGLIDSEVVRRAMKEKKRAWRTDKRKA